MSTAHPPEPGTTTTPEATKPKAIVLFSDGTGNSSAALFKTNVWRMYEAVDLGPPAEGKRPQIAYYDDGVGTSSFKPFAALGGALGWGLKRNVLDIYRYVCRNYREGDEIYVFGFSRGAFTARLVVALIAAEGLVKSEGETELRHKTLRAYRRLRSGLLPRRLEWPTTLARLVRDGLVEARDRLLGRPPYDPEENARPHVRFIGVWDTVGAYGGPIIEITRAIDNWFFRISMPDYRLDGKVTCARHALAIDDERDAFHPLLWDEVHEATLVASDEVPPDRLRQVWFSGMHSDVGGGYPDESLSYVPLLWMMEEAEQQGLRTLSYIKERILALASSYGPIHHSRSGLGAYYRYQPRKIAAWLHPIDERLLSVQDPLIAPEGEPPQGLLCTVRVHESVINRIATGTDRYAPITLPDAFEVVPPEVVGETSPQPTSDRGPAVQSSPPARALIDPALRARLRDPALAERRRAAFERVWDLVWWRRVVYFATLGLTLVLVAMPLFVGSLDEGVLRTDGRTVIGGIIRLLTLVLPSFASTWIDVYADHPYQFLALVGGIWVLLSIGTWLEQRLRDKARALWRAEFAQVLLTSETSLVGRMRNSRLYQRGLQVTKWRLLPDFVITPLLVAALAYLLLGGYTQAWLSFAESGHLFCVPPDVAPATISTVSAEISTRDMCSASLGTVQRGERYQVTFDLAGKAPWSDASQRATPLGVRSSEFPYGLGYLGVPLRRVIRAHYLQPLIEIRARHDADRRWDDVEIYALPTRQVEGSQTLFRAEFEAPDTGDLFVFVNDSVLPLERGLGKYNYRYFYEESGPAGAKGNHGSASVTVEAVSDAQENRRRRGQPVASVPHRSPVRSHHAALSPDG